MKFPGEPRVKIQDLCYESETTAFVFGELQYFSVDTHTIHPPNLCFKWDDSIHNSQSLAKLTGDLNVSLYRNGEEYNQNDEAIFRIHIRDKYPVRQFTSSSNPDGIEIKLLT